MISQSWSGNCSAKVLAVISFHTAAAMSAKSSLLRSGGITIGKAFNRKNKSLRKFPSLTSVRRSRFVAHTSLKSTGSFSVAPIGSTECSCRIRKSLLCISNGISPISSRKSVPPFAACTMPWWSMEAPVYEPFLAPSKRLSARFLAMAPQLSATKGPSHRGLFLCMNWAAISLPTPDSPCKSTGIFERAAIDSNFSCFFIIFYGDLYWSLSII